ncbi:hypothetical protein [Alkalihalobacillus sp. AL-G]|uniref:hypothetical protein n=1 Tax=Alkalihalobacillus sp. AL-G TaxID=2926399 RepID=UPI00272A6335|nr:hypothetical protein [Alkalihalobacillus sp. AL-G]WLD92782.1 hypothetical protein MOJ78_17490 [Alkalihalobacillus sp. AL-G]
MATVMISVIPGVSEKMNIPRTLQVPFKLGRTCGEPFDFETRKKVVQQALAVTTENAGVIEQYT